MAKSKDEAQERQAAPQPGPQPGPPPAQAQPQQQPQEAAQQQINIDETEASTTEADFFVGSFGVTEALLGFGNISRDGSRTAKIKSKIVMSAPNAKRVMLTLQNLVQRYEEQFGTIQV